MSSFETMKRDRTLKPINNDAGAKSTCKTDLKILVPVRYSKIGLLNIAEEVEVVAIVCVVVGDRFNVINIAARIRFSPYRTETTKIFEKDYYVFSFKKGQSFADRTIIKDTDIIRPIVEETMIKGNFPFFFDYEDAKELFNGFYKYIGNTIADDDNVVDIILSLAARTKKSVKRHWRHREKGDELEWVGIGKVGLSRNDGYNRMTGAYLREGIISSSLDDKDKITTIEKIIK